MKLSETITHAEITEDGCISVKGKCKASDVKPDHDIMAYLGIEKWREE